MFLPIGDENPTSTTPYVTWALIALNTVIYLWTAGLGLEDGNWLIENWALWPDRVAPHAFITANFLHGGLTHLLGNMLFLWILGDNVEDRLGHVWYAVVYLACGIVAMLAHLLIHAGAPVPVIGASGCISGVMAMYVLFYPDAQIKVLYWFFFIGIWYVPAKFLIGFYLVMDVFHALTTESSMGGGTAHFAHIGGFAAGLGAAWFVLNKVEQGTPPPRRAPAPKPSRRGTVFDSPLGSMFGGAAPPPVPDGIDADGNPFFSSTPAAPAEDDVRSAQWRPGPAGNWVVMASSDTAMTGAESLTTALAESTERTPAEVAESMRSERGFLARGVTEPQARELVQSLIRAGVPSVAREESSLRALPELVAVERALFTREGAEAATSSGMLRFSFNEVELAVVGRLQRSGSRFRPSYALFMTLFLRNGPRVLFVEDESEVKAARAAGMASGLPLRGQAVWVLNHAPSAGRNGGMEALAGGRSRADWEPYTFDGFRAYEAYTAWMWQVRGG